MYNVLLVSNQTLMRAALKKTIEKNTKFNIIAEAKTPKEAISIIRKENINLIFSEFMMPSMNGLDFMEIVEKENKDIEIFLLAFASDLYSRENEDINLNMLILKPINFEKVNEKLMIYERNHAKGFKKDFVFQMKENINMNDFNEVYKYLIEEIDKLNLKEVNAENIHLIKEKLEFIGGKIINLNSMADESKILYKKFPINELIITDKRLCHIWLFKIVEYYFKKKSVINYPILKDVFTYIDGNLDKNISLSDVVKECNISQGYLSRLFKGEYNTTVVNYIHLKKINLAKEYIILENKSVSDITFNLGYNECGYFSKVFKKYEKITVEQYRKAR